MSHMWMSRVTHVNESRHTWKWVMSHIWMSHVTHMNEPCHTYEWAMSHIWMSHVTHRHDAKKNFPESQRLIITSSSIGLFCRYSGCFAQKRPIKLCHHLAQQPPQEVSRNDSASSYQVSWGSFAGTSSSVADIQSCFAQKSPTKQRKRALQNSATVLPSSRHKKCREMIAPRQFEIYYMAFSRVYRALLRIYTQRVYTALLRIFPQVRCPRESHPPCSAAATRSFAKW